MTSKEIEEHKKLLWQLEPSFKEEYDDLLEDMSYS